MADIDSDSGWAHKANVPDGPWNESPEPSPEPDITMNQTTTTGTGATAANVDADQEMAAMQLGFVTSRLGSKTFFLLSKALHPVAEVPVINRERVKNKSSHDLRTLFVYSDSAKALRNLILTRMASLETENKSLKLKNTRLKQQLAAEKKRVEDLEKALKEFQSNNCKGEDDDDESEEDASELLAIWDDHDCIYRCSGCSWEVVLGICQSCGEEFDYTSDDEERETILGVSHSVENEALSLDRVLSQRFTTPLLDIDSSRRMPSSLNGHIPEWMYIELLERGATRLMCQTFFLDYSDEKGIVAWADAELYEGFTLPHLPTSGDTATEERTIKKGDYWKIYLGRRIVLDEDDYDGSCFIEDIIEDGTLFTSSRAANKETVPDMDLEEDEEEREKKEEREEREAQDWWHIDKPIVWKTFLESPGIWATQPSFQCSDESAGPIVDVGYLTDHDHDESDQEDVSMDLDTNDRENASGMADIDIEIDEEDSDSGWAYKANVPDRPWDESPEPPSPAPPDTAMDQTATTGTGATAENADADQEMAPFEYEEDDGDSFDSDFDSEEELSGDEIKY